MVPRRSPTCNPPVGHTGLCQPEFPHCPQPSYLLCPSLSGVTSRVHTLLPPIYQYLTVIFETPLPAPSLPPALPRAVCVPAPAMLLQCPVVLSVPAAAGLGLSLLSPVPHPGDCPGQPQLLARSHARGAAVLQHPRQAQTRALLAARHILGTTSHQELGAHLLGVLPSPPCVPKAPGGVPPPPTSWSRSCAQGKEGHPQPPAVALR